MDLEQPFLEWKISTIFTAAAAAAAAADNSLLLCRMFSSEARVHRDDGAAVLDDRLPYGAQVGERWEEHLSLPRVHGEPLDVGTAHCEIGAHYLECQFMVSGLMQRR